LFSATTALDSTPLGPRVVLGVGWRADTVGVAVTD